jgi:hypothetical protein
MEDEMTEYTCIVCFEEIAVTREPWRPVDSAVGLLFAHDKHSESDVRDGVLFAEGQIPVSY